jgi:predicted phage baseplate assembly protein
LSSISASCADSTLQVCVNDLKWHEVPSLFDAEPRDRVFVTRTSDDDKTTVEFGDGSTGARAPTGQQNGRAVYRKGIGTGGNVKTGQLSLLLTRPLGVKAVINPIAANGGADSEKLEDARSNAPVTVLTLDRVVSLRDYEDFARGFAGIAKALATWTWDGQTRGVFVTVAGPSGAKIPDGSKTLTNLIAAMQSAGDPHVPLRVQTYRPGLFRLSALVVINPDYQQDKVIAAVTDALRTGFSFDARAFGQGVALSQVVAGMQAVPGVDAVDVTKLYRVGDAAELNARLPAAMPQAGSEGTVQAAELLILDPGPIDLGVVS